MKRIALVVFCILMVVSSWCQEVFNFGLSATLSSTWILKQDNYSTLTPFQDTIIRKSDMKYKAIVGGNVGVVVGYNLTPNWSIRAEIQYNFTGQSYDDNYTGPAVLPGVGTFGSISQPVNVIRNVRLQYVQVPLMAKYTSKKWNKVKIFVCLGPQFGFRTYAYEQVKIAGYAYIPPDSLTPNQKFRAFDFGLALQAGADIFIIPNLYFEPAFSSYIGLTDMNGKVLSDLDWYSKNNSSYRSSHNFRAGLMAGIHYVFIKQKKSDKEEKLRF